MKSKKILAMIMAATIAFQTVGTTTAVYGMDGNALNATPGNAIQVVNPAVYQGENYQVEFHVDTEWQVGYNGTITITNVCEKPIDNWYLSFELEDEIQNLQCGTIMEHEGSRYLVKNAGWNKDIPVGGSVSFTFTAAKAGETVIFPAEYSMDTALLEVPSENYRADFQVQSDWGSGFTSVLVITNTSQETISDWKLLFSFAGEISSIGGGQLVMSENGLYELEAFSYDYGIAPGESRSIQIIGSRENESVVPTDISLMTVEYYEPTAQPEIVPGVVEVDDSAFRAELEKMKELNGGELPVMYLDEEDDIPCFISGKFSDVLVTDFDSAVLALHDITYLMEIDWETISFAGVNAKSYGGRTYYRLQEYYEGLRVCGKQLIVTTDEEGNIVTLSGDFDPIFDEESGILVDFETATSKAEEALGRLSEDGILVWYSFEEGYDEPAWYFEGNEECIYISARYGDELTRYPTVAASRQINIAEDGRYYYTEHENQVYFLKDTLRNIEVVDCSEYISVVEKDEIKNKNADKITFSQEWTSEQIELMCDAESIYDKVLETLGIAGYNSENSLLKIAYNTWDGNNSFGDSEHGMIRIGKTYMSKYVLEVMAHEYGHLVEGSVSGLLLDDKAGTIKEAYADCFSELLDMMINGDDSWLHGTRNIANPQADNLESKMPIRYMDTYYKIRTKEDNYDNGYVHHNSTIISHSVFYKLYKNLVDSQNENATAYCDAKIIMELLYRSLYYMAASSDYYNCGYALCQASKDMGLDETLVIKAFKDAGIVFQEWKNVGNKKIIITVVDEHNGKPIPYAKICVKYGLFFSGKEINGYTDGNGTAEFFIKDTKNKFIVEAKGYKKEEEIYYEKGDDGIITVGLGKDESVDNRAVQATGYIYDATKNFALSDVRIRLRSGMNNTKGRYVMDEYNQVITFYTDPSGWYSIDGIDSGIYTAELLKDGYLVGYEEIIVSKKFEEKEYNTYLSPKMEDGQYRITLRWGASPSDLDAHLVASREGIEQYHIYFGNRNYVSPAGVTEASLDYDIVSGRGPETITFYVNPEYEYEYFVNWYYGAGTWYSSGAQVSWFNNKDTKRISLNRYSDIKGKNWYVFRIKNGEFEDTDLRGELREFLLSENV